MTKRKHGLKVARVVAASERETEDFRDELSEAVAEIFDAATGDADIVALDRIDHGVHVIEANLGVTIPDVRDLLDNAGSKTYMSLTASSKKAMEAARYFEDEYADSDSEECKRDMAIVVRTTAMLVAIAKNVVRRNYS